MADDIYINGEAAVVGPHDILVLTVPEGTTHIEPLAILLDRILGSDRFLILCGGIDMFVQKDE